MGDCLVTVAFVFLLFFQAWGFQYQNLINLSADPEASFVPSEFRFTSSTFFLWPENYFIVCFANSIIYIYN